MKKLGSGKFLFLPLIIFGILFLVFFILDFALAFVGPSVDQYSGYGLIKASSSKASIGSADPTATSSLLITGADSGDVNFSLRVENSDGDPILQIRNDRVVGVGNIPAGIRAPDDLELTHGYTQPYYLLQAESLRSATGTLNYPGSAGDINRTGLFVDEWYVTSSIIGLVHISKIKNFRTIQVDQVDPFEALAGRITGYPSSTNGVFGSLTGAGVFTFPGELGINTSTNATTSHALAVYGDLYLSTTTYIGINPVSNPGMLNIDSSNVWFQSWNKGIRLENISGFDSSIEFGRNSGGNRVYGVGSLDYSGTNRILSFFNDVELPESPFFPNETPLNFKDDMKVGINNLVPDTELDVVGLLKATEGFQIATTSDVTNQALYSFDAVGNATWGNVPALPPTGNPGDTIYHDGNNWVANNTIYNDGSYIGIGATPGPTGTLLEVGSGGYFQIAPNPYAHQVPPPTTDCDSDSERGRILYEASSTRIYICNGAIRGWDKAPAFWYDENWSNRKKITIDHNQVDGSGALIDFPVLVNLATDVDINATAQSDFDDLVFTTDNGFTKLDHELEKDGSSKVAAAWVRIPTLSGSQDTEIYVYYGNSGVSNQENISGIWNSNFKAVWHLNEVVTDEASGGSHIDSTSNSNTGIQSANSPISGKIVPSVTYQAQHFDGNDYITVSDRDYFSPGYNDMTVSFWAKSTGGALRGFGLSCRGNGAYPIGKATNIDSRYEWAFENDESDTQTRRCLITWSLSGTSHGVVSQIGTRDTDTWKYYTGVFKGAGPDQVLNELILYMEGVQVAIKTSIFSGQMPSASAGTSNVIIGMGYYPISNYGFIGAIDEVQISNTARSPEWIKTSYNNQNNPSIFYSLGAQE